MSLDIRNTQLAQILVQHSLEVQKGDRVVIQISDFQALELVSECLKLIIQKGAYVYFDVMGWTWIQGKSSVGNLAKIFFDNANEDQLVNVPKVYKEIVEWGNKFLRITTMDNYSHLNGIDIKKKQIRDVAKGPWFREMIGKRWVLTYYPTKALAKQSGMTFEDLQSFYFNSSIVDYNEMEKRGEKVGKLIDDSSEVRIVGERTDLTLNIEDRFADNACGTINVPDGEVFCAPHKGGVNGEVFFDLLNFKDGVDVVDTHLVVKNGKIIKATAKEGEKMLLESLDTDEGSRYFGELGFGMNYGITQPMRNILYDEKIGGTIHLALGRSYTERKGGALVNNNISAIHWDLVKDMRKKGSKIFFDKNLVFENGIWL